MRFKLFLMSSTSILWLAILFAPEASAGTVDVSADGNTYLVDGAVIHHQRFENDRTEAARCTTCHWRIHLICRTWSDTAHGACPSLARDCPADETVAEVERAEASQRPEATSQLWHLVGHTCIGDDGPASVTVIEQELRKRWRIPVPRLTFTTSPPRNTLLNLETFVQMTAATRIPDKTQILVGIPVTFRASSQRHITCTPACEFNSVRQSFFPHVSGSSTVTVVAQWTASYDALGLKNLPVSSAPIVQRRSQPLQVVRLHRTFLSIN